MMRPLDDWAPHAHEDPPPPGGLSASAYHARWLAALPDVGTETRAMAWACGKAEWSGPPPLMLIDGQGQLGEVQRG